MDSARRRHPGTPATGSSRVDPRRRTGARGERAAAEHLSGLGFSVLERNARTRYGELDLVCHGGDLLLFVEVKALAGRGPGDAERALESIGPRKRLQIRRLARAWLAEHGPIGGYTRIRFDAIGVSIGPGGRPNGLVHLPAAF
jgi:putative endonuclease